MIYKLKCYKDKSSRAAFKFCLQDERHSHNDANFDAFSAEEVPLDNDYLYRIFCLAADVVRERIHDEERAVITWG